MTEREKFEKWFASMYWTPLASPENGDGDCDGFFSTYDDYTNEYQESHTQMAWEGWQGKNDTSLHDRAVYLLRGLIECGGSKNYEAYRLLSVEYLKEGK